MNAPAQSSTAVAVRRDANQGGPSPSGSDVDLQIRTAKMFPRSISDFKQRATEMATLDEATAEACIYAFKRGGKIIEGPSARLAEIVASTWGNLRVAAKTTGTDDGWVYAESACWDLETNVAISYETRRRITDSDGKRFSEDMIGVTANAAVSIALRNSVFRVVPRSYVNEVYGAARKVAAGNTGTLKERRASMLKFFAGLGISEQQVLDLVGVQKVGQIEVDHLAALRGVATSLRENTASIEEVFGSGDEDRPGQKTPPPGSTTDGQVGDNADDDGREAAMPPEPEPETPVAPPKSNGQGKSPFSQQKGSMVSQILDEVSMQIPGDNPADQGARLKVLKETFGTTVIEKIGALPLPVLTAGLKALKKRPADQSEAQAEVAE